MKKFDMVVATDLNWGIGINGNLLAHIPEDIGYFYCLTTDSIVVMGRKTQESLPNHDYLNNRYNLIVTSQKINNKRSTDECYEYKIIEPINDKFQYGEVTSKLYLGERIIQYESTDIESLAHIENTIANIKYANTDMKNVLNMAESWSCHIGKELPIYLIGGSSVYKQALDLDLIDRIYLTKIYKHFPDVDKYIPCPYDYGFRYNPNNKNHVVTGYEIPSESSGKEKLKFSISVLTKD